MAPELKELTAFPKQETKTLETASSSGPTNDGLSFYEKLNPEDQAKFLEAIENNTVEQAESGEPEPSAPVTKLAEAALDKTTQETENKPASRPEAPIKKVPTPLEAQSQLAKPKRSPAQDHADSHHSSQQPSMRTDGLQDLAKIRDLTQELAAAKQGEGRRHRRVQYTPVLQQAATEHHAEKVQPPATNPNRREAQPPKAAQPPESRSSQPPQPPESSQPSWQPERPRQSRQEFVKQQEQLWGAKDKIDPKNVPEGELTWEQYLAQRPKGEAGDTYHIHDVNGKERILDVTTGKQLTAEQRIAKEETRERENNPRQYYDAQGEQREIERAHEKQRREIEAAHEEAIAEDAVKERAWANIIRSNAEGAIIAQKEPHLRGLLALGQEVGAFYQRQKQGEVLDEKTVSDFEAKKMVFEDMLSLYQDKGLDERALMYIGDVTGAIDDPDFIPVEGSASYKGEKVKVIDLIESPKIDGVEQKIAYTIEGEDGTPQTVNANEVQFKREFPVPEAEKLSLFQRVKNWFKGEGAKLRQYGGKAYVGGLWDRMATATEDLLSRTKAGRWLTEHGITPDMTPEQVQAQKLKNRSNNLLGLSIIVGMTILASKTGIFIGTMLEDHGGLADTLPPHPGSATSFDTDTLHKLKEVGPAPVVHLPLEGAPNNPNVITPSADLGVNAPSYDIPSGGRGLDLFASRGLSATDWYNHAADLVRIAPQDFEVRPDGDVWIRHSGELSVQARQFIESLRR